MPKVIKKGSIATTKGPVVVGNGMDTDEGPMTNIPSVGSILPSIERAVALSEAEDNIPQVGLSGKSPHDLVFFIPYKDINPAPRSGGFLAEEELGVPYLKAKTAYKVPRHVATHWKESGQGVISEM